jgi:hypothetical protein
MKEAGFIDIDVRAMPDLSPIGDDDWVAVFLGSKAEAP